MGGRRGWAPRPLDDHTLWAAAGDGDRDAFATLYRRHADAVWRHAYRLTGSRTAAEDVVAETFYTAWRRRSEVRLATLRHERLAQRVGQPAPSAVAGNELWTPAGRHDVGDAAPTALVARIGDAAAGICIVDPNRGPVFAYERLPAKPDPGRVLFALNGEAAVGVVLTAPSEDLTRVEIALAADPAGARACTIVTGLVVCTLEPDAGPDSDIVDVVVTAYPAGSAQGTVLFRTGDVPR